MTGTVYLLHFSKPVAHARHYLGFTTRTPEQRLADGSKAARLVRVARGRGAEVTVARTWNGGRHLERHLKSRKDAPQLCPICRGDVADG